MQISDDMVNKSINFILENLDKKISVEDVASHCNVSKYHFNRYFKARTGESVYSFIKRQKLDKSAFKLTTEKGRNITDIGLDYGYNASNFSTVFKKQHSIPPNQYKKHKSELDLKHPFYTTEVKYKDFDFYNSRIEVRELEELTVLFKRYMGSYRDMSVHWHEYSETYRDLINEKTLFIETTYDDPNITDRDRCIYDLSITVDKSHQFPNIKTLRGGLFALYRFRGSVEEIFNAYKGIFNIWLPESPYELDNRISYDIYRQADCENNFFEMDICIPVK